ncbi:uncharacterized protein LOC109541990 [Dendroctonus ponderosae]|uniref:Uncharacterized protein n=1 Tax=Dendroctonus ponderosae TaxID=77166 RepID=J3JVU1_DENPD
MSVSSDTGGVKPMKIAGRFVNERERLAGMSDAERAWRKQWLQDQVLAPNEPRHVPEIYEATRNPFRRLYRWPMNQVMKVLVPVIGAEKAHTFRGVSSVLTLSVLAGYWLYYNYKYHSNEWQRSGGWKSYTARKAVLPGDPGYPAVSDRTQGADYASRGFKDFHLDI